MKYCMNCMNEIDEQAVKCEYCGQSVNFDVALEHIKPGTILKQKYLVGKAIGQGGFGITYIGRDLNLYRKIAIKELFFKGYSARDHRKSNSIYLSVDGKADLFKHLKNTFLSEARTIANFDNEPSVVNVIDVFEENETAYIIMSYLEGKTLSECVQESGPFDPETLCNLMLPIMEVLSRIHKKGIIHRDISPDNIIQLKDGRFVLFDFGAARNFELQQTMTIILKAGFAPFEQYSKKLPQGPWTDVYALCATMYYCLSGQIPETSYDRKNDPEIVLVKPSAFGLRISQELEKCILKGMAINKEDRFQDMIEMEKAIQKASQHEIVDHFTMPDNNFIFAETDLHYILGSSDKALYILLEGLKISPNSYGLNLRLGIALRQLGLYSQALVYSNKAEKLYNITSASNYDRAMLKDDSGDYLQAKYFYEKAIAEEELRVKHDNTSRMLRDEKWEKDVLKTLYLLYARCIGITGDIQKAQEFLEKASKRSVNTELYSISRVKICQMLHIDPYQHMPHHRSKNSADTDKSLAEIFNEADKLYEASDYNNTLLTLIKGLKIDPNNPELLLKLGRTYRCLGKYPKAMECYEKAMSLSPDNPIVYSNIGMLQMIMGNNKTARGYFGKAISLIEASHYRNSETVYATVFANYALLLGRMGDMNEAKFFLYRAYKGGYRKDYLRNICTELHIDPTPYMK